MLTAHEFDNRGMDTPQGGKASGVKFVSAKAPGGQGIVRPPKHEGKLSNNFSPILSIAKLRNPVAFNEHLLQRRVSCRLIKTGLSAMQEQNLLFKSHRSGQEPPLLTATFINSLWLF